MYICVEMAEGSTNCIDTVMLSFSSMEAPSLGLNLTCVANALAGADGLRKRRFPRCPRLEEKRATLAPTRGVDDGVVSEQHIFGVVVVVVEGLGWIFDGEVKLSEVEV